MLCRALRTLVVFLWLCGLLLAADPSGIWLNVPFVKQKKDGCGAASIAMVMQYWLRQQGQPAHGTADAAEIQRALFSRQARGIYASDLERYLRQQGYRTFAFRGEWTDLKQHLEKGRPLIAALKPAAMVPMHYVVVTGLDEERQLVLLNDPAQRKLLKEDRSSFEREWKGARHWTLLALPNIASH